MAKEKIRLDRMLGLSKGSTYRLSPDTAIELEVYAKVGKYGTKKQILEESLKLFYKHNKIKTAVRDAAILLLEEEAKS